MFLLGYEPSGGITQSYVRSNINYDNYIVSSHHVCNYACTNFDQSQSFFRIFNNSFMKIKLIIVRHEKPLCFLTTLSNKTVCDRREFHKLEISPFRFNISTNISNINKTTSAYS